MIEDVIKVKIKYMKKKKTNKQIQFKKGKNFFLLDKYLECTQKKII